MQHVAPADQQVTCAWKAAAPCAFPLAVSNCCACGEKHHKQFDLRNLKSATRTFVSAFQEQA